MNDKTKYSHTKLIYGGQCIIDENNFYVLKRYLDKCKEKYSYEVIERKYKVTLE